MGKSTISMAIFNSYVKLPEGNQRLKGATKKHGNPPTHRAIDEAHSVILSESHSGNPVTTTAWCWFQQTGQARVYVQL